MFCCGCSKKDHGKVFNKSRRKGGENHARAKRRNAKSSNGKKVTSKKQAIAIGLSEARREGAKVPKKKD